MTRSRRLGAALAALLLSPLLILGSALPAAAHDKLVESSPAEKSTVTEELSEIVLTFSEKPAAFDGAAIDIEVLDPQEKKLSTGKVTVEGYTIQKAFTPSVQGTYTVLFQNISSDAHVTPGEFTFNYQGPVAETAPEPTMTTQATAPAEAASDPVTEPADKDKTSGLPAPLAWALLVVGIIFVVGSLTVMVVMFRRNRIPKLGR